MRGEILNWILTRCIADADNKLSSSMKGQGERAWLKDGEAITWIDGGEAERLRSAHESGDPGSRTLKKWPAGNSGVENQRKMEGRKPLTQKRKPYLTFSKRPENGHGTDRKKGKIRGGKRGNGIGIGERRAGGLEKSKVRTEEHS